MCTGGGGGDIIIIIIMFLNTPTRGAKGGGSTTHTHTKPKRYTIHIIPSNVLSGSMHTTARLRTGYVLQRALVDDIK